MIDKAIARAKKYLQKQGRSQKEGLIRRTSKRTHTHFLRLRLWKHCSDMLGLHPGGELAQCGWRGNFLVWGRLGIAVRIPDQPC